jgi:hypothetical protein
MLFSSKMQFHRVTSTGDIAEVIIGELTDAFCSDPYDKITFSV